MTPARYAKFAWSTLVATVAVIAGGALVRATGSGAGCGSHWPDCNGTLVPFSGSVETSIEFAHRATSGLAFFAVIALYAMARRRFEPTHRTRRAARWSLGFMVGEVVIGALLVTYEWVGDDASVARAVVDGVHLVNTFFLVATLTATAWWASGKPGLDLERDPTSRRQITRGLVAMLVVAAAGAMTALGDTLFPPQSVGEGLWSDLTSLRDFLVALRVVHPILAVAAGLYVIWVARHFIGSRDAQVHRVATAVAALVGVQVFAGVLNVSLLAPVWMQLVHLAMADALFISLVLLGLTTLATQSGSVPDEAAEAVAVR